MSVFELLHPHAGHRTRQLRWVVPLILVVLAGTLATLGLDYVVSDREIGQEFFRAHKTIHHTGELLERGLLVGGVAMTALLAAVATWALRVTHRIVRPVHALHQALDALVAGDLGVRVELHRRDEFQEVGDALNRLVDEFALTLGRVHGLSDEVVALAATAVSAPPDAVSATRLHALARELDQAMDFFRLGPKRVIGA